jgi:hypothetical protein
MRKFSEVFKEKQAKAISVNESVVLTSFQKVYKVLLEKYDITNFYDLNEETQNSFARELNSYWTEESGLTERGHRFLKNTSETLHESATALQKKNYLKKKATTVISETIRQADMKYKLYDVIDEMFQQVNGEKLADVLTPEQIVNVLSECFSESLSNFVAEIDQELKQTKKR